MTLPDRLAELPLGLLLGGFVGVLLCLLILVLLISSFRLRAQAQQALVEQLTARDQEVAELQQLLRESHGRVQALEASLQASKREAMEKAQLLHSARMQFAQEFEALSNRLFDAKNEALQTQNQRNMGQLLQPFRDQLAEFRRRIDAVYDSETRDRVSLQQEIQALKALNQQMSQDAVNLTRALKGDNKAQGDWGEMVLERLLELSGLQRGREYLTQQSVTGDGGQRLRPDVIVRLPDNKDVIIDAKVSLVGWERLSSAVDDAEATQALEQLLNSVRQHVRGLSSKAYQDVPELRTLDFVLLFVPIEGAFLKMLSADPALWQGAYDRQVMIVGPSTLMVTLRMLYNLWRSEYQQQHVLTIAERAGALHDQFVRFAESLQDVGDKIDRAQQAYHTAHRRLVAGKGNIVGRVAELETLGAKAKKRLPDALLQQASESEQSEVPVAEDESTVS